MSKRPTAFEIEEYLERYNYIDVINNINKFNCETLECLIIKKEQIGNIFKDFHHHSLYEMLYISKGKVQYGIEDKKYDLNAGDFVLIAPNILHKLLKIVEEPCERIILTFTKKFIDTFKTENTDLSVIFQKIASSNNHKLTVLPAFKEEIADTLNKMQGLFLSKEYGDDILFKAYFAQLLVRMNKEVSFIENEDELNENNNIIHKARMFAINNLDKKISVSDIASEVGLSVSRLSHLFKEKTGISLLKFLNKKRLTRAKDLLKNGYSITNTANKCGYQDYTSFIRAFTKEYGISPTQYIKDSKE